jgi:ferredoxin--NADP+ reductase
MNSEAGGGCQVAVVGAGPAGIFAARLLALQGVSVALLNRDIKPGGLAVYGIYPDKYKLRDAWLNQFHQALVHENIHYFGNLQVGESGDLSLGELRMLGFRAVLVAAGAQGTKWLGLPGEELRGVYHAKDIVYHYNGLPPFSQYSFEIGRRVAVVGVGNVMTDISHYLIDRLRVDEVTAIARRGPAEIKFERKELEAVANNLDMKDLDEEIGAAAPLMRSLGQDPGSVLSFIQAANEHALPCDSPTHFRLRFLLSPARILADDDGRVCGLELETNTLVPKNGDTSASGTGIYQVLPVDTIIFAIGDMVDEQLGLPVEQGQFAKNPEPKFPVEGISYEAWDPNAGSAIPDVFLTGWSRNASSGLVGIARRDGENGARAVLQYLQTIPPAEVSLEALEQRLADLGVPYTTKAGYQRLLEAEKKRAASLGFDRYQFTTNEEMLAAMQNPPA